MAGAQGQAGTDISVPEEYREIATICKATEIEIGGKKVIGIADARTLHKGLGVKTRVLAWFSDKVLKNSEFSRGIDYENVTESDYRNFGNQKLKRNGGDRRSIPYRLTLNAAKRVAMAAHSETGALVRGYFIWCETQFLAGTIPQAPGGDGIIALRARLADFMAAYERDRMTADENFETLMRKITDRNAEADNAGSLTKDWFLSVDYLNGAYHERIKVDRKGRKNLASVVTARLFAWSIRNGIEIRPSVGTPIRPMFHISAVDGWMTHGDGQEIIDRHLLPQKEREIDEIKKKRDAEAYQRAVKKAEQNTSDEAKSNQKVMPFPHVVPKNTP